MKARLFTFIARCFLIYQLVKLAKTLANVTNRYAEQRLRIERTYGPRTDYRRR